MRRWACHLLGGQDHEPGRHVSATMCACSPAVMSNVFKRNFLSPLFPCCGVTAPPQHIHASIHRHQRPLMDLLQFLLLDAGGHGHQNPLQHPRLVPAGPPGDRHTSQRVRALDSVGTGADSTADKHLAKLTISAHVAIASRAAHCTTLWVEPLKRSSPGPALPNTEETAGQE